MAETNEERDLRELKETFEKWFMGLLLRGDSSCLERDVLRNQRKNLLAEWIKVRPVWTTTDCDEADRDAVALKKRMDTHQRLRDV